MKKLLLLTILFPGLLLSQIPKRQTLAAAGGSHLVSNGSGLYFLYHSIGQSGVIGTVGINQTQLRQGYVQPLPPIVLGGDPNVLEVVVFPNPFVNGVVVTLENGLGEGVDAQLFDATGRLVFQKTYPPSNQLGISLPALSQGSYFLTLVSGRKRATKQLIKL
ncbi:T9SS type A sorting domain-containing protein [Maribacter sp. 2307ULW6-5]|uniref:T9SS type A sorting domain-containing protein n=1 Tax=Maribacter sp. 2307ULW6-5 TaxID=3386275 RepID=UPI0039BD5740